VWRAFIVKYLTMRRKSLISRGGQIGIPLLRQTVITVIFTVPINFIHIQTDVSLKTHFSIMYAENSTTAYRNHNNAKPVRASPQCCTGHPAEGSTTSAGCIVLKILIHYYTNK